MFIYLILVLLEGKKLSIEVVPRKTGPSQKGSIGIGIASKVKYFNKLKASNPVEALSYAYDETARITDTTYSGTISSLLSSSIYPSHYPIPLMGYLTGIFCIIALKSTTIFSSH